MIRFLPMLLVVLLFGGCQGTPPAPVLQLPPADPAIALRAEVWSRPVDMPADLNSAQVAAMYIAQQAPIEDKATRREIELHVALYRLAFESKSVRDNRYCLLEPLGEGMPLNLAMTPREFRLQVLGRLFDLDAALAWGESIQGEPSEREYFPGTRHQATRLRFRIEDRNDDSSPIRGVISDWTVGVGASRQGFSASWDGSAWQITRDRVRLAW